MTTTTSKTTNKHSKSLETLIRNSIWEYHVWNWKGKDKLRILNLSNSDKDVKFLRDQGYEKINTIDPNNITNLDNEREYHVAISIYPNDQIKNYEDREEYMYEMYERVHLNGAIFICVSNKSGIELDCNIIEENKSYTWYVT